MKRYVISAVVALVILLQDSNAYAKETEGFCVTGSFSEYEGDYVFRVEILADSSAQLSNMISVRNDKSYVIINISESLFDEHFNFSDKYTFIINDTDSDGKYEIDNFGEKHCYLRWDKYGEYCGKVSGYFEKECDSINFHDEYFDETSVYKFVIVSSDNDDIKKEYFIYMVYEKDYFEENFGYDGSYSLSVFDTGETYDGDKMYSMFSPEFLRYFKFGFEVSDKEEMISDAKAEKQKEIEDAFKPMIIVVVVLIISGIGYSIIHKKFIGKKR